MTTNQTNSDLIEALHQTFCALTGTEPRLKVWERAWFDFVQAGYTQDDLRCTLLWLNRENRRNDFKRSTSIMKLIGNGLEQFDDYLATARAIERNHKPVTAKQKVVQEFRRFQESEVPAAARQIGQIIQQFKEI